MQNKIKIMNNSDDLTKRGLKENTRIDWLSGRWRSCPEDSDFRRRSWIWRENAMGTFQVEYFVRRVELIRDLSNNSYGLDLDIRGRIWCQVGRTVRNSLDIHTIEIPTALGLCGSVNRPGIETRSTLIFFSVVVNCLQYLKLLSTQPRYYSWNFSLGWKMKSKKFLHYCNGKNFYFSLSVLGIKFHNWYQEFRVDNGDTEQCLVETDSHTHKYKSMSICSSSVRQKRTKQSSFSL